MSCVSFLEGELNYLLLHYINFDSKTVQQMSIIEIVTDPYGTVGDTRSIYSLTKFDVELPRRKYGFKMLVSENLLLMYPIKNLTKSHDNFQIYSNKTLFHTRICHYREYRNEETGECEPCPYG